MRLDPHTQSIGVIELASAMFDDVIIVKLHMKILEDRSLYDALSYVWGDETITETVSPPGLCEGLNLHEETRRLKEEIALSVPPFPMRCIFRASQ
jgi:hypothetical protein